MFESYIFLGISAILVARFLMCDEVDKSVLCAIGMMICFGCLGYFMRAHYFGYIVVFLGLVMGVVILSFRLILIGEKTELDEKKGRAKKEVIISGVLLLIVFGIISLIFRKNGYYFNSKFTSVTAYRNIFEVIKEEHFLSMGLMMVLMLASLVCINVIVKKE